MHPSQINQSPALTAHPSMAAAWYGLGILVAAIILSMVNLQMIFVLIEAIKTDLALSDSRVGALTGLAIGLATLLATLPMGWLSDKVNRKILLSICVLVWTSSTAVFGFSTTYNELFLAVVGIAIGEAVLGPIVYSIIPDLFPENRRVLANYIFFSASIVGAAAGLMLSGATISLIDTYRDTLTLIPENFETWRIAIIASALPGPFVAGLILMMKLKPRQSVPQSDKSSISGVTAYILRHPRTLIGIFLGFGLSYSAKSTMFVWAPPALIRIFGENASTASIRLGLVTVTSSIVGILLSSFVYYRLRRSMGERAGVRVAQYSLYIAATISLLLLYSKNLTLVYGALFIFSAAATAAMSLSPTILQEIAPAAIRGRVIAVGGMCSILIGAITPLLVGVISDLLSPAPNALIFAMVIVGGPALAISSFILRFSEKTISGTMADARSAQEAAK